ncbi:hypothetical protein ROZALSC1DRAFT_30520 [Rozella allomycis CSF55]|uniref:Uncharacterized protein n=1 Tax=Rozella allomycis (strain CSF55) TaxID=988480 RepID=A0A075B2S0_ROZAC|nr:hypothetical protein O9G_004735 [Rozella allomycis CSF55]RKP17710.1 hypothetical protein ROZALSC1DRAFT_30520 [Rozella allomycis CSF55]|eukprot:EPZ36867.1 hypothetical protein O9G_004735 [Rozella allomycis CSF55]
METEVKAYLASFSYEKNMKISEALVANAIRAHQVEAETVTINGKTNMVTVILSSPDEAKKINEETQMSTVLISGKRVYIRNRDRLNIYMLRARNIPGAIIIIERETAQERREIGKTNYVARDRTQDHTDTGHAFGHPATSS